MITHIIYHIPGRKVGCTRDFVGRKKWYSKGVVLEVLEELHNATDQEAGDREWFWAEKFGYKKGVHYTRTPGVILDKSFIRELASRRGSKTVELKIGVHALTHDQKVIIGRRAGKRTDEVMTKEEKTERGINGGNASMALGVGIHGMSHEEHVEAGNRGGRSAFRLGVGAHSLTVDQKVKYGKKNGGFVQLQQCPYCGIVSHIAILTRWHFNKCKQKPRMRRRDGK